MTRRSRVVAASAAVVVLVVVVSGYVAQRYAGEKRSVPVVTGQHHPPGGRLPAARPVIVFRNTSLGAANGLVATVALRDPSGPRRIIGPDCDRVYAVRTTEICLQTRGSSETTYTGQVRNGTGRVVSSWPLPGAPSRARISPSGRLVADTAFVTGHAYENVGFSTATVIHRTDGTSFGNLERFTLLFHGKAITPKDRNLWGVTFANDHLFYATAAWSGTAWLVRGDLSRRTLTVLHPNAECPSLAPGGRRIAYKKRVPAHSDHWSLAVLDLSTGHETVLGEPRSVNDQAEWLNDHTLLYGMPRTGHPGVSDVWAVGTSPGDRPRLFIKNALSPSVLR